MRIAQVPASVTADSRLTRQRIECGPNSPGSSFRLPDAIDLSLAAGQHDDIHYMERALAQARHATAIGEVPVGAVLIRNGSVLAEAHNLIETTPNATAHAEMLVLNEAARLTPSWRLGGVALYVTLEPCPMCAGAMVLARIDRLVYGAPDPKKGAFDSVYDGVRPPENSTRGESTSGTLGEPDGRHFGAAFAARHG